MAGLTGGRRDADRGQLLVVGAFGLAVLLLVLASVLNGAAYTENLATRGDGRPARDAAAFQTDARGAVQGVLVRVNDDGAGYPTARARVNRSVGNWSAAAERHYAREVGSAGVAVTGLRNGATVEQTATRPLTNATGRPDWTLVRDVTRVDAAELTVSRSSLPGTRCGPGNCTTLVVRNGTSTWTLALNDSAVVVEGPGGVGGQCPVTADPVVLNLTAGTVNGDDCAPLSLGEGVERPATLRYRNGDEANGTYRLTVAGTAETDNFAASGDPSATPFVYAASVRVTFATPSLRYATAFRVVAGETDA